MIPSDSIGLVEIRALLFKDSTIGQVIRKNNRILDNLYRDSRGYVYSLETVWTKRPCKVQGVGPPFRRAPNVLGSQECSEPRHERHSP